MKPTQVLVVFSLALSSLISSSSSQAEKTVVGHCHCDYFPPGYALHDEACNSSNICTAFDPPQTFPVCLIDHIPRRSNRSHVDVHSSCVKSLLHFGIVCSNFGQFAGYDDYSISIVNSDPLEFSICCLSPMCNTPEIYEEILSLLRPPTTLAQVSGSTEEDPAPSPPPLYALVSIPILAVLLVVSVIACTVFGCFFAVSAYRKKSSTGDPVPTINSQESSSCGTPSLNNLPDYSGSGAGLPLLVQTSIAGQISLHELIGKGRFGEVWKGSYKCDEVAVKIFNTVEEASWLHEIDIYNTSLVRHPNILRFIASDNRDIGVRVELWLITEFCEYGSLYDFLIQETLEPPTMLHLAYTACCGLDHLHTEIVGHEAKPAIVHRDLKSRNILVKNDYTCCIGDLGLALRYDRASDKVENPPTKRVGTKRYLAPEIIDESVTFKHFESFKRADMYSFGLVLWEIAMRGEVNGVAEDYQMPYQNLVPSDPSFEDMKKTVVTEKMRPTLPNRWTQSELFRGMSKLIQQCWLHESDARLTSLRLKKSLHNLQQSAVSDKKKGKEQSA